MSYAKLGLLIMVALLASLPVYGDGLCEREEPLVPQPHSCEGCQDEYGLYECIYYTQLTEEQCKDTDDDYWHCYSQSSTCYGITIHYPFGGCEGAFDIYSDQCIHTQQIAAEGQSSGNPPCE